MKKRRMTDIDIQMVIEEIQAWANFERGRKLTWSILENVFPFTRQTMYSKEEIVLAYKSAKATLSSGKKKQYKVKEVPTDDLKVQRLKNRILELEKQVEAFQELWVRYEFNAIRYGMDPEVLRRGLPEKPVAH